MKRRGSRIVAGAVLIAVVGGIYVAQGHLTQIRDGGLSRERMSWLVRDERVEPFLLGFADTYAAFLWIRTTLYVGGHYQSDRDFEWLVAMTDAATRINPGFLPPYEFAALLIPSYCGNPGAARVILERGMCSRAAREWRVPFYLGWLYQQEFGDRERAAHFVGVAAQCPGAPVLIARLAATLMDQAAGPSEARRFLESLAVSVQDPLVRTMVMEKMRRLDLLQ